MRGERLFLHQIMNQISSPEILQRKRIFKSEEELGVKVRTVRLTALSDCHCLFQMIISCD
jgi:hypothetical protein